MALELFQPLYTQICFPLDKVESIVKNSLGMFLPGTWEELKFDLKL